MSYLSTIKTGAINTWHEYQVLPSITGAQAALESGYGTSALARPPYNNQFGIKASADWTGRTVTMPTREYVNGNWISIEASFRAYDDKNQSVTDHGSFFTSTAWRLENYKHVVGETDYKKACWALQNAGYATDQGYAQKLINIIEQNNLVAWDREALSSNPSETIATPVNPVSKVKNVGGTLTEAGRSNASKLSVTVIGDSLGVGTRQYLQNLVPDSNYDVLGSRQMTHSDDSLDATQVLRNLKTAGTLKEYIVVIIGTNRGVTAQEVTDFVNIAGTTHKILFVNTASQVNHANTVSQHYEDASKRLSNAYFVDWKKQATPLMAQYYSRDGANGEYIHMTPAGYEKHAEFIAQALYEASTINFNSGKEAETPQIKYFNIIDIELTVDGEIHYEAYRPEPDGTSTKVKRTDKIDIKGLYSPLGDPHIYNPQANQTWGYGSSVNNSNWIEGTYENPERGDTVMLIKEAAVEMMKHADAERLYTVKLMDMPPDISIGDTGIFIDHEYNPPLYIEGRVLSLTESKSNPSLSTVTIGNVTELTPQNKSEINRLMTQLQNEREELRREWVENGDIEVVVSSTNGVTLGDRVMETNLVANVMRSGTDITEDFHVFKWERVSGDREKDTIFNQMLSETVQSSVLPVVSRDVVGNQSQFISRVFNMQNELVNQSEITIKHVDTALWTDTDDEPYDAKDGAAWTKSDGTQYVKVAGEWEERVDQETASQIVRRDGVTVTFGNVEPEAGKQGDVWFRLNDDSTESMMRHDGTGFKETVTNAMNADGIVAGTVDFSQVNAINITASSITAGHAEFLEVALSALNSRAVLNGTALRILNDDGSFVEMNNVPEIRSTAPNRTSIVLGNGRLHFFDSSGNSKGYMGTDMHDGTADLGTFLSKNSNIYRFARLSGEGTGDAKYYTVEYGDARVSIITKLVQRGLLPDGDADDFVRKSNLIARLNGWALLPTEWPPLNIGQQIKYAEASGGKVTNAQYYTVQAGQGWNAIAESAGVPLQDILDLNNLTIDSIVHPGDTLLIRQGEVDEGAESYEDLMTFSKSTTSEDWEINMKKYVQFEAGSSLSSDRRIKKNIEDTDVVALEHIEALEFKQFDKLNTSNHTDIGLIAQDAGILRVENEVEGVDLEAALMLSLKGIQELKGIVERQADEIKRLRKEV